MSGNPDLKPETHHALSAQFRNKVFYANIKYQHISNYIASTVQYDHDAYSMHYDNIPSADEILVNVMYSPKTKYWSPVFRKPARVEHQDEYRKQRKDIQLSCILYRPAQPVQYMEEHAAMG